MEIRVHHCDEATVHLGHVGTRGQRYHARKLAELKAKAAKTNVAAMTRG